MRKLSCGTHRLVTGLVFYLWASYQIRKKCGLRMRREWQERFPRHWLQMKPQVINPGMYHGTCVTHVPWCMSGSITRGDGENFPGIPCACETRDFTYLARGPWLDIGMSSLVQDYHLHAGNNTGEWNVSSSNLVTIVRALLISQYRKIARDTIIVVCVTGGWLCQSRELIKGAFSTSCWTYLTFQTSHFYFTYMFYTLR